MRISHTTTLLYFNCIQQLKTALRCKISHSRILLEYVSICWHPQKQNVLCSTSLVQNSGIFKLGPYIHMFLCLNHSYWPKVLESVPKTFKGLCSSLPAETIYWTNVILLGRMTHFTHRNPVNIGPGIKDTGILLFLNFFLLFVCLFQNTIWTGKKTIFDWTTNVVIINCHNGNNYYYYYYYLCYYESLLCKTYYNKGVCVIVCFGKKYKSALNIPHVYYDTLHWQMIHHFQNELLYMFWLCWNRKRDWDVFVFYLHNLYSIWWSITKWLTGDFSKRKLQPHLLQLLILGLARFW